MATATQPTVTSSFSQPSDDEWSLSSTKTRVDKAAADFESGKAALYRQDGTPKYGQQEHQEREAALFETLTSEVQRARQVAAEVRGRCDQEAKLKDTDPLLRLTSPSEQSEVTFKQGIISDDATKSALPALAQRLDAIAVHGSKVEKLLYARYARARVNEEKQQYLDSSTRRGTADRPSTVSGPAPDGLGAVTRAVEALEQATADPQLQAQLKKMEERRKGAMDLQLHAGNRLADFDGSRERARQRMRSYT